ncbi:MAG: hypothetical protein K0S14_1202 [Thermomicrobiales bacterium]|nr:hypothetical protein [Thermomicrobiales bacterium]
MSKIHRSRPAISAFAAVLMLTVSAPIAVHGQDEDLALAPVPAASWDETSGYGAVEAIRAEPDVYVVPGAGTTANAASGSDSVEVIRVSIVQHALQASDLGSMQEEALAAIVAPGASWDETSGYGAVEASRATIGHPAASTTNQANRVFAAERALLSHDLGSMQEEALAAVVADPMAPAQSSDYGSLEATHAELLAQFRAIELALSSGLGEE